MSTVGATLNRLSMEQVLLAPERAAWFDGLMQGLTNDPDMAKLLKSPEQMQGGDDDYWPQPDSWEARYKPYVVQNGVLQIPVQGVLLNRMQWQIGNYATGYQYIERAMKRGLADDNVKAIAFIINSPGGEVSGNFELVDRIYGARGEKPMRAFAYDHAYSAAYSIASAADQIVMTRTGGVGSIGVVTAHIDFSEAMKQAGIKVTFIHAPEGGQKVEGNPYEKLSDDAKERIQKRINKLYGIFVSTVARNRGIAESAVRATKAGCFETEEAIEIGLADSEGVFEETLEAFETEANSREESEDMSTQDNVTGKKPAGGADEAAVNAARAEGHAAGVKEGNEQAKTRINAILGCDNAKERPLAAFGAAMDTDMTAEQANTFLGRLPVEKPEAKTEPKKEGDPKEPEAKGGKEQGSNTMFDSAMGKGPRVGGGEPDDHQSEEQADASGGLLGAYGAATGRDFNKKK